AEAGLPTTEPIPDSASGELRTVTFDDDGTGTDDAPDGARIVEFQVQVEDGLPADGERFAQFVADVLADERSWRADADGADVHLRPAASDEAGDSEVSIVLASPDLVDELCAPLQTGGQYSCASDGRA